MKEIHWKNLNRLYVWCMVGADAQTGYGQFTELEKVTLKPCVLIGTL